ncbi:alpha/beta fold hydrolase [Streptomyces sp. M19]
MFRPSPDCAVRLVCLPHAGGSASFFFPVATALAPTVEVLAVQYPGRQTRRHEPGIDNIPDYADQIFAALRHLDDRPLALFGHSMGAVLAYEVALRMREAGLPDPVRLFASGRRALPVPRRAGARGDRRGRGGRTARPQRPQQGGPCRPRGAGDVPPGDPQRLRRHRELPARPRPDARLPADRAHRRRGPRTTLDEARAWEAHTTGPTDVQVFPGGHFFHVERSAEVVALLARALSGQGADTIR